MAVTLADVATRARVSTATVSRVLNGNYPVAENTRARVLRAVAELEYVVNGPASALAAATSDLVGILVNDIADPFFGIIASAVQSEMSTGTGQHIGGGTVIRTGDGDTRRSPGGGPAFVPADEKLAVVCNTGGSPERELTYLTLLQRQRAAAVVLTGGAVEDAGHAAAVTATLKRLASSGTRVVLCGRPPLGPEADARKIGVAAGTRTGVEARIVERAVQQADAVPPPVTLAFDNRGGAQRLTEHLISLGHQRIGYVAGPVGRTTTRHRLEGHRAALAAHGIPDPAHRTVHGAYDRAVGYDAALELLRRDSTLTAVIAANDTAALGVCAALRDRGLRIPGDISVAGFDDLPFSADAAPALTTVRLPLQEAGARAGRLAMGRETPPPGEIATLRGDLMVRESTASPYA
ncbi:LacI family transcriptional regulator [Streptomyces albofaciens JCM 4342]|uniref:LacI family DNA-binding transcriptional regulator n=1 Tax=Streptomyces albofaciens TaxID=66866 RepID=UPI00123BAD53|nr:LacI family DNA-binding transcriptional regulator [Streptomyces albofaciens]KAA6221801.1 LacI family transcriptional regulator [Streptomyces albofaciens JCM 4342]